LCPGLALGYWYLSFLFGFSLLLENRLRRNLKRLLFPSLLIHIDLLPNGNDVHDHPVQKQSGRCVIQDEEEHDRHSVHHEFSCHATLLGTRLAYLEREDH